MVIIVIVTTLRINLGRKKSSDILHIGSHEVATCVCAYVFVQSMMMFKSCFGRQTRELIY